MSPGDLSPASVCPESVGGDNCACCLVTRDSLGCEQLCCGEARGLVGCWVPGTEGSDSLSTQQRYVEEAGMVREGHGSSHQCLVIFHFFVPDAKPRDPYRKGKPHVWK